MGTTRCGAAPGWLAQTGDEWVREKREVMDE